MFNGCFYKIFYMAILNFRAYVIYYFRQFNVTIL